MSKPYCKDYFNRQRLKTIEVTIGDKKIGGENPILLQSMTTTNTMETELSIQQSQRLIEAGCELIRLTAPSKNEAYNLKNIRDGLQKLGHTTPLVADIHFTPNAAEIAATIVQKIRVNPGNYADKKKFEEIDYTEETYSQELKRIEEKFTPLIDICKKHNTAMRIGTNHGSLSDRILSKYGDTPEGMVESAMEFIRICEKNEFFNIVISMKASNTVVMVQAYRLLVASMLEKGLCYPLHLGVTEAGDGEDGRIKSAVGIGALLEDGIGDTIRVSLTEEPEIEIPVARILAQKHNNLTNLKTLESGANLSYSPYFYEKHHGTEHHNIGGNHHPIVFADLSNKTTITEANFYGFGYAYSKELDKWNILDLAADYVYIGSNKLTFQVPGTLGIVVDYENWIEHYQNKAGYYAYSKTLLNTNQIYFYEPENLLNLPEDILNHPNAILIYSTEYDNKTQVLRKAISNMKQLKITNPIILRNNYSIQDTETFQIYAASDLGSILIDGFGDGIWINATQSIQTINACSFGILQATRTRMSKTEYISCPSCGRTLFDLQETTAKIRQQTSHLKGLKIGIMGCIVNGPGEMADADYGYVGTGPGKINLYKEKNVVAKNIPETEAVAALIDLIKENGDWIDKEV